MDLSLLIQDNTGLDSTETAMREYASVELLVFQNQYGEVMNRQAATDVLIIYPTHFPGLIDWERWLTALRPRLDDPDRQVREDAEAIFKRAREAGRVTEAGGQGAG